MKPPASAKAVPAKSPQAFRTISEVAEALDVPAHVLRCWETRFSQIRPVKRAGGRRLYRPEHVALIAGIRALLHDDGLTIKGVQKMLRTDGTRAVVARGRTGAALRVAEVPRDAVERQAPQRARRSAPAAPPAP
ncbi:MAG: MerR family transcriptional regulator, partial [Paracoccaceae bacterium]